MNGDPNEPVETPTIGAIADFLGGRDRLRVLGGGSLETPIRAPVPLTDAGPETVAFMTAAVAARGVRLEGHAPSLLILDESVAVDDATLAAAGVTAVLASDRPRLEFLRAAGRYFERPRRSGVHGTTVVAASAVLAPDVAVGPLCTVGERCRIGEGSRLEAGVHLYDDVTVGRNVHIHAGAVIGADGFGYERNERGELEKFPHLGGVEICDDVDIGANACVDRASLGVTYIGRGAKVDNLVHIAHNVHLGEDSVVIALSLVGGSARIGRGAWVSPSACVRDTVAVGDGATVGLASLVTRDVPAGATVMGAPARDNAEFRMLLDEWRKLIDAAPVPVTGPVRDYFSEEVQHRQGLSIRQDDLEATLQEMNRLLAASEAPDAAQRHPTILVFGLPRSGTTLVYQLCWSLEVGYPNNIIARFWEAPQFGVALSRALIGDQRDDSFASAYGRTPGLAGPHEFRFFWKRWLGLDTMLDHLDFGPEFRTPDARGLRRALGGLQAAFDQPLAFKSLYFGQFLPPLLEAIDKPLVVYVERDPRYVALSILASRRAYYADPGVWWSSFPPDYAAIQDLPFPEQIARQVVGLRRVYDERIARTPSGMVVHVQYDDVCERPASVVARVQDLAAAAYCSDIALANEPPVAFPRRERILADVDADEQAVLDALDALLEDEG